jgi:hypothetical protein
MAQITILDDLFLPVQQYAKQTGKTQEEVVQEALTDLLAANAFVTSPDPALVLLSINACCRSSLIL